MSSQSPKPFPYTLHFSLEDRHGSADFLHAEFVQSIGRREIYNLVETVRLGVFVPFYRCRIISDPLFKTFYDLCKDCGMKISLEPNRMDNDMDKDRLDEMFHDWFQEDVTMKIVVRRDGENVFNISIKNESEDDDGVEDENEMNIRYLTRFLFF